MRWHKVFECLPVVCLLSSGCGTYAGNPEGDNSGGQAGGTPPTGGETLDGKGSIKLAITDAAIDDAAHVFVSFNRIEISTSGDSWIEIPLGSTETFDIAALRDGVAAPLAALSSLPAGDYQQIRLGLDPERPPVLELKDGTEHTLTIPSGAESGLKLVGGFKVVEGESLNLTIDFDLRKSLVRTGGGSYRMKPVLRVVADAQAAVLEGEADEAGSVVCVYEAGRAKDTDDSCDGAITSAIVKEDKSFVAAFLPPGDYEMRVFSPTAGTYSDVIEDVSLQAGKKVKLDKVTTSAEETQTEDEEEDDESELITGSNTNGKDKGKGGKEKEEKPA